MLTTTLLTLVLLSPAQAEEACKTCWNATCADLKDFGIPACQGKPKQAKPKKEPQAPSKGQGKAGITWVRTQGVVLASG
jgi:hypothetical protein